MIRRLGQSRFVWYHEGDLVTFSHKDQWIVYRYLISYLTFQWIVKYVLSGGFHGKFQDE